MSNQKKVVAFGDSGVYGYGVPRRCTWVSLVANQLDIEILNRGITGDTTGGMLIRLDKDVLQEKPTVVVIMGGGNDIFATHNTSTAKANMWTIGQQCLSAQIPILFLIGLTPVNIGRPDWRPLVYFDGLQDEFNKYYDWLQLYADTFGFECIHCDKVLQSTYDGPIDDLFQIDGFHLTRQGHEILSKAVAEKLKEYLDS